MIRMKKQWCLGLYLLTLAAVVSPTGATNASETLSEQELWDVLQSGNHFVMLRHAIAPGMGDPPDFTLGDCNTQRNLSDEGRRQAGDIGKRLRRNGIVDVRVYSSQWCRCMETAELLGVGKVEELSALNSFFGRYEQKQERMEALRTWLVDQQLETPFVLVSHQVNITALTGVFPSSGEMVVVRRDGGGQFVSVGTLETD